MTVDLAIVGAGPAGMAAAVLAAELSLGVLLIDEAASPGGQIYRGVELAVANSPLGADYLTGKLVVAALRASKAQYRPATTVWHIDSDGTLSLENGGATDTVAARRARVAGARASPRRGRRLGGR